MLLPIKDPGVLFRPQDHPSAHTLLGQLNILADSRSRQTPIDTDWSLDLTTFIILWEEPWPLPYGPFPNREQQAEGLHFSIPRPFVFRGERPFPPLEVWDSLYISPASPLDGGVACTSTDVQRQVRANNTILARSRWFPLS